MIPMENSNSDRCLLVLARPADSISEVVAPIFRRCGYSYINCSTIYEVVNSIKDIPAGQPVILVVRPAMLNPQAAFFMKQSFSNLIIIGWTDSDENGADQAISQATAKGMITVSHPAQLREIIQMHLKTDTRIPSSLNSIRQEGMGRSERLEYELTDDEVAALLGGE